MRFISSLTSSLKDVIGAEKKLVWNEQELRWFQKMAPEMRAMADVIKERFEPYVKKAGEPIMSRSEFKEVCKVILKEDFCLSKDEMRSVDLDEVFNTHAKAQSDGLKDQIRALCVLRCLISPFSEPTNFFYWFALCDTNRSGGLDVYEFRQLLQEKFRGANQGKVRSLTDKFFPEDEDDNVMLNFLKKISRKEEVSLQDYLRAFPQDLLHECYCADIMKRCK